jgi:glyoxylase-like metal-dependent hydrolase (beta-lactamase superfamily II)
MDMLSWKVGAVKITRVVEKDSAITYNAAAPFIKQATPEAIKAIPWLYPNFATEDGVLMLSIHALLVEAPGLRLVVDTCIGNDKRTATARTPLSTNFLEKFAETGWTREGVDMVVCTHLHLDHVGWNTMLQDGKWVPTFPNARYLIARNEMEWAAAEDDEEQQIVLSDSVKPVFDAGLAELIEPDHRISPEIRLVPTHGHTPGHVSVVIESEGQRGVITGDMTHHPCQLVHPDWGVFIDTDPEQATATRRRMFAEWVDQPTLVIGTHFAAPTAGWLRRDGDGYRFEA